MTTIGAAFVLFLSLACCICYCVCVKQPAYDADEDSQELVPAEWGHEIAQNSMTLDD